MLKTLNDRISQYLFNNSHKSAFRTELYFYYIKLTSKYFNKIDTN